MLYLPLVQLALQIQLVQVIPYLQIDQFLPLLHQDLGNLCDLLLQVNLAFQEDLWFQVGQKLLVDQQHHHLRFLPV